MSASVVPYVACDGFMRGWIGDDWAIGQVEEGLAVRFPLDVPVPEWPDADSKAVHLATFECALLGEVSDLELEAWMKVARSPTRRLSSGSVAGVLRTFDVELARRGLRIVRPATPSAPWDVRTADVVMLLDGRVKQKGSLLALDRCGWRVLLASQSSWAELMTSAPLLRPRR